MTPLTPLKYFKPHKSVYILVHISKGNNLKVKLFHIFAFFGSYDPFLHQNDVISTHFAQFEHILTHLTPLKYFKPHKSVYILVHISKGNNLKVKFFHIFAFFGSYDPFLHQNDVISTRFAQFEHILTHLTPLKYFKPHKSVYIQ